MLRSLAILIVVAASVGTGAAVDSAVVKLPPREQFHLFLLVGQSNMAGRGTVADEDRAPHPRVLMLTKEGTWAPAVEPLHFDKPVAGVGPGRAFGVAIAEASEPEVTIGLIPCAAGGSPIEAWTPGGYHDQTKSHPWDDAIRRAKLAQQHGTLRGILWHQGESDSSAGKAEAYEMKLHDLIARFRKELQAPDVPFLAGQLGQFEDRPWDDSKRLVDAAHRALPDKVARAAFVTSDGLTHKGDGVHFDARSARELGRRFAKESLRLTRSAATAKE
jgi:hypothetical protein